MDAWNGTSYVAELQHGDVLIIPPYWWHHVSTIQPSISANVWSYAPEYHSLEVVYKRPVCVCIKIARGTTNIYTHTRMHTISFSLSLSLS